MSHTTRSGAATTLTVVAPTVTDFDNGDHCPAGIHNQVFNPTYVRAGGEGAKCTSGTAKRNSPNAFRASTAGSGALPPRMKTIDCVPVVPGRMQRKIRPSCGEPPSAFHISEAGSGCGLMSRM